VSEPSIDISQYVELIKTRGGPGADPLLLVDIAAGIGRDLANAGDLVTEHFVGEAHQTGYSWTQIGDRLGVTRQAARQRFGVGPLRLLDNAEIEVRPRLQACLDRAQAEAEQDGCEQTDTHYLLLGLLHVGVAAAALDRLGVTRDRVYEAIRTLFGAPTDRRPQRAPVFSEDARQAIEGAQIVAWERGQCYVGTEHLLFCLATDPGSQARRVLNYLDVQVEAVKRELEGAVPHRPRRARRRKREQVCAFCGKSASPIVRLVGGPGVCICDDCAHRAVDTLSQPGR